MKASTSRTWVKKTVLRNLAHLGFYVPKSSAEKAVVPGVSTSYVTRGPDLSLRDEPQSSLVFATPPPQVEQATDLYYTAAGMAWAGGRLIERWSVREPSVREALQWPVFARGVRTVDSAVIVESDLPYTYGDWLHTYFGTVLLGKPLDAPLLLPGFLARKSYVQRDLQIAGIHHIVIDAPIHVRSAMILRKQTPLFYWTEREVEAYQDVFAPVRPTPATHSLMYMGRFNLMSEIRRKPFPSDEVAQVTQKLGGQVIRQDTLSPARSKELAGAVETVIADHGSGVLNILHWRPRNIIELVVDNWWNNNNLFVARAQGVENFAVLDIDGLEPGQIESLIRACLARFSVPAPKAGA